MAHAADTNLSGTLCNGLAIVQMLRAKNYLMDLRNLSSWNRNLNRNRSLWGGRLEVQGGAFLGVRVCGRGRQKQFY